jgi:hypothetical protein
MNHHPAPSPITRRNHPAQTLLTRWLLVVGVMAMMVPVSWGQTLFDSFTDGNFTASPVWGGSTSAWGIQANSDVAAGATASNTLRLASTGTATVYLSSQVSSWGSSQEWGVWIGRRAQALTAANRSYFWLFANESNVTSATVDGYRLAIGDDTGNDEIRLEYIVNGAVSATVITSTGSFTNGLTDIGFLVRVTRSSAGDWALFTSTLPTANGAGAIASAVPNSTNASVSQGSATNNSLAPATNNFLGVAALHSSGASGIAGAEFDQIYFTPTAAGLTPPVLTAAGSATVDAPFSVTFPEDATWRGAITGVTVGGTPLTAGFAVTSGTITFTPSASVPANLLQASGTKTISVQATGYSSATVSQTIGAGAATQLAITTQPTAPAANPGALAAQPVVVIRDQYANLTSSTATVTAAVGAGTWTLGGTTAVAATAGTATFSGLTATAAAAVTGATISFTSPGLTSVTSGTFNIPAPVTAIATGGDVTQNFDSLGTGTNLASLLGWSHIGTLGGDNDSWGTSIPTTGAQSAATAGTVNNTLIVDTDPPATTDRSNTQAYNFALTGSTSNRAIGTSPTTGAGNILQFRILNSTGASVSTVSVSYDIRRFTAPATANELPGYRLFYSTDSGSTWTNVTSLNPALTGATVNVPNTVGVTSVALTAITLSPALPNGSEIRFRWIDDNATETSPDQIIGLDNVVVNFPLPVVAPTVTTTTPATSITPSTATAGGNITATGGANATIRGVEYSTTNGFANGTGTPVTESGSFGTGTFTRSLTGLISNTVYYFKAFATNSAGTAYGTQGTFTTTTPSGTITTGGTVTARSTTYGTASTAASFTVSGANLTGNLTVTPPAGFETSLTEGSGYGATTTITASGTLASTTVYVRLAAATAPGTFSGNIVVSGGGASSQNVAIPASTVSTKELTLTGAAVTTKSYDTNTTATITGTLSGIVSPDVVTFTGTGTFASADVSTGIAVTAAIVLTGADAAKYTILQPTGLTGEIIKANQTITFAALPSKLTTDAAFALTATASSGLPVSYNSANTAVATISGSTLEIVGIAGSSVITASQAGDANYNAAPSVQQTQTVTTGPTVLTAGDIAVLALQTDDADEFAFVTLVDLNPTTQVSFTDNAWTGSALNSNENTIVWQVPAGGLTAGSVVTFTNPTGFSTGTTVSGSYSGASASGDQVIVYQGTPASPTFIYAFSNITWITTGSPGNSNSYLPTGLTNGTSARDLTTSEDNSYYGHPATFGADKAAFLTAIGNTANWQRDDARVTQLPTWTFITPATNLTVTTRLAKLGSWKYLDSGVDPGTSWRNAGFDDSTWSSGTAPLGEGDAHITTSINTGTSTARHTVYFRKTFTVPNAASVAHLRLNVLRDDGVVVYLNGTEVARDNITSGTVAHNDLAPNNTEGAAESAYWTSNALPLASLVNGTNTIAVQVHNRSLTSSDLGFDLEIVEYATPPTAVAATGQFDFAPHDGAATSFAYNGTAISNVTVSDITYVGVTPGNNDPNLQGQWPNTGTLNASGAANSALVGTPNTGAYYQFTLTADAGYILSNPKLRFNVGREANGPRQFQWRSSVDGFVSPIPATLAINAASTDGGVTTNPGTEIFGNEFRGADVNFFGSDAITPTNYNEVSLTTTNRSAITFRFYAYGAEFNNGGARLTRFLDFLLDVTQLSTAVPSAPVITGITANNNQLRIAFTPPSGTVTGYEYSIDGGATWTATSPAIPTSPLVINGLTNGQVYAVQLRASNGNGTGDASAVTNGTPQPNTITGLAATDTRTLNGGSYTLGATASSGLTVSYASSNTGVATVSGSTVTIEGAGTTTITASQPGDGDFAAATPLTQTLTVLPAGWNLIENFESRTLGNLDTQNNWSVVVGAVGGTGTTTVTADPADAVNKVATLSGTHTAASRFMASLSPTETVTLFKRFRLENIDTSATNNSESHLNMGVSNLAAPSGAGDFSLHTSVTPTVTTPFRIRHTPESAPTNVTVASDIWYSSWYVVNNSTGKFKLYIQGGSQTSPVLAADGTVTDGLWTYRNAGAITAARIYLRTLANHNAPAYVDDLYFAAGENLAAPVDVAALATGTATGITRTTATISGNNVSSDSNSPISERGVVYATSANPTTANTKVIVSGTTGSFDAALTGLTGGTTYHVRAYATNAIGTAYGSGITFTANAAPVFSGMTVSTQPATSVPIIESKILARITDGDGGPAAITSVAATSTEGGTLSRSGGIITYTPALAFSGPDSFTVSVDDGFGAVNVTIQVTVAADPLFTSPANAPRLTDLGGGAKRIAFNGIPGRTYAIQRSTTLDPGSWTQIAAVTAASDSTVSYEDPTPPQPAAFYRVAYPAQ